MKLGVNFFGSSETSDGIGRAASLNIKCLENAGLEVSEYVLSRPVALQSGKNTLIDENLIRSLVNKINIFHFSARWVPHYFSKLGDRSLEGFYNIGYWVCETPKIPEYWAWQANYFNEIWTASIFCQAAIARSVKLPVVRIPHPIENNKVTKRIRRRLNREREDKFNFLTIFNTYSDAERKNILFSVRCFIEAFKENKNICYNIKVSNIEQDPELNTILTNIDRNFENINVISGYVEDDIIKNLYEITDAYVSLHRAEGFGLTISDAISRGIPIITTGYSGNMDFCAPFDTNLVKYKLEKVGHERLRYRSDDIWAEPDMESAIKAFCEMVRNYDEKIEMAQHARERVEKEFGINSVSRLMMERISLIHSGFMYTNDLEERFLDRKVECYKTYGF